MARAFLSVLFLFLLAAPAWAGPFGTEMGDPPSKFESLSKISGTDHYYTTTMPKPHSELSEYILTFRDNGLSAIKASSPWGSYDQAALLHSQIKEGLIEKYGEPTLKSVASEERGKYPTVDKTLFLWSSPTLPENLSIISVAIVKNEKEKTYYTGVVFYYKNEAAAKKAQNEKDKDAL